MYMNSREWKQQYSNVMPPPEVVKLFFGWGRGGRGGGGGGAGSEFTFIGWDERVTSVGVVHQLRRQRPCSSSFP